MSTTEQRQVAVSNEFFAKAKNDYRNWLLAIVREFFQNSVDAGSMRIRVTCEDGVLTWEDDGCGMNRDTLVNKLLTLGTSTKEFRLKTMDVLYEKYSEDHANNAIQRSAVFNEVAESLGYDQIPTGLWLSTFRNKS